VTLVKSVWLAHGRGAVVFSAACWRLSSTPERIYWLADDWRRLLACLLGFCWLRCGWWRV
jgi:hypothetical protein